MTHQHVHCNGELTFYKKEGKRQMYKCDKCRAVVNCILCYSYEEMKEMGIVK